MINIRKAKEKDLNEIWDVDQMDLYLNINSPLDKLKPRRRKKDDNKYYQKFMHGKKKWCLVAEEDGEILGFALFNINKRESYYRIKETGYLDLIFVRKKARKRGVGKMLEKEAYKIFKKEGIKYAQITVLEKNENAKKHWKNSGYKTFRLEMYKKI